MKNTESGTAYCTSCVHFGYCMVYWGVECKRQGGKRIPRMKPAPIDIMQQHPTIPKEAMKVRMQKPDNLRAISPQKPDKPKTPNKKAMMKKIVDIFEPIRTKVVNW